MTKTTRIQQLWSVLFVLIILSSCKDNGGTPTGSVSATDVAGSWSGYIWTDAGPRFDLAVYLYQRSNGELAGDFAADARFCAASGEVSGSVSGGTDIRLTFKAQNASLNGAGTIYLDSRGKAQEIEVYVNGTGWCNGQAGVVRLWMQEAGW